MTDYLKSISFIEKNMLDFDQPEQLVGTIPVLENNGMSVGIPVGLFVGGAKRAPLGSAVADKSYYPTLIETFGDDVLSSTALLAGGEPAKKRRDTVKMCEWCPEEMFDSLFEKVSVQNKGKNSRKTKKAIRL